MARSARALGRRSDTSARKPIAIGRRLDICERHLSERPNRCEGLVYEVRGEVAKAASRNTLCRGCRRPLARVLDQIREVHPKAACDFCTRLRRPVAESKDGMLGVRMKICEGCASDALAALRKARGSSTSEEDE